MTANSGRLPVHLKRDIGIFGASFLALNAMIGSGIFALPGKVAVNAGLLSPWLFIVVGALFITVVLTFAELSSYYDRTGGPVLYATDAFGPLAGFSTGWAFYLSRMTAFAANANVMAIYLASLHDVFAGDTAKVVIITVATVGMTWANILGVRDGVRTMAVFTFLKITPLVLMILLGFQYVTGATLIPGGPLVVEELGGTTLLLIYAYIGFETVGVTAGETSNPKKTLPKAYVGTMLATTLLYFLVVLVFVSVIAPDNYSSATLVDVGRTLAGPFGAIAITLAAVFSIGGNLASSMLAAPRIIFSMAENRMLPEWFGHIHSKYATPDRSILLMGAMALFMALTGTFVKLAIASSVLRLLGYIVCIASLPAVRRNADDDARARAFRLKGGYAVPFIALVICFWLLAQSEQHSWITVAVLLGVGWLFYALERWATSRRQA
ncbi:MAG: APC family permease [Gammaproteobacteria bacterium]|nr:APC family permease [Gammaproteobacteria bacterium]MDH5240153.1 APC family permease [Gammaproteobacteria bacterium]MDH5583065.1 APC family permease [Gammaproteobacteria bacterium]